MVQGYYTLQEAAQVLTMSVEELKLMAQKAQIRSFQDRGTLRFRIQDIQELARLRGGSSDPELALGDMSLELPKSSVSPRSGSKKSAASAKTPAKKDAPDVFDFDSGSDDADFGVGLLGQPSGAKKKSKLGQKSPPHAGSDSDVRLVFDGSDATFAIQPEKEAKPVDSKAKLPLEPAKGKTGVHVPASNVKRASQLAIGSSTQAKSKLESTPHQPARNVPQPQDCGVRLIPLDHDSDVKLLGASDEVSLGTGPGGGGTDSNVRLERVQMPPADSGEGHMMLTEEINLDEEIRKQLEREKNQATTKFKPKSELKLPTSSPFELSESDLELPAALKRGAQPKTPVSKKRNDDSSDFELDTQQQDGSSDFDLTPQPPDDSSDFSIDVVGGDGTVLTEDDGDLSLEVGDDNDQALDQQGTELTISSSGIALDSPADDGLSLEQSEQTDFDANDNVDFDLSLDVESTPKPALDEAVDDLDSDFEINATDDSDSEFEINAQATPRPTESSPVEGDSDFDLSLEVDDEPAPLQTKGKKPKVQAPAASSDNGDFELNLEGSGEGALGSEAPPEDSEFELNLEGSGEGGASTPQQDSDSEFDLTLDDSDDEPAPQVKSKKKKSSAGTQAIDQDEILETDFDVPALDESDEATIADSELESSDFDIALDDSELAQEEESGSQVVALDEDEANADTDVEAEVDHDAAVVDDVDVDEESSEFSDLDADAQVDDVEVDADEETAGEKEIVVKAQLLPAAPWGAMPVIFMVPCVVIMFLVGLLAFEMVQSTVSLKPPGPLTVTVASMFGSPIEVKTR